MFDIQKSLIIVALAMGASVASYFAGVHHERKANEAKVNKAIVAEIPKVAAKEAATNKAIEGVGNETESNVTALAGRLAAANIELGRLRIKRACTDSNAPAATNPRNAASDPTGPVYGPGTGEINLDEVAGEVIQLGNDYDAANIRINELRALVRVYEKACKVD